ncbi:hypothetical protein DUNSADRAFT_3912 [Dunaliella salina]|uniref:Tyrosine specific protein phosphatases domain-containing protein n=1 Tax=Dunaliella salina TaxID=3046 RepID=A0ABQ7GT32_DUNSA|nr:hypothetical protein DUNSADRAFT_3912 [Dunaliella salina]|eukprot:KAF5837769.1 hypothetical protein DUNSADRAFT_3912 [Dunaliella salina]
MCAPLVHAQKWGDYAAIGAPVGRFIPCKTPISREILSDRTLVPSAPKHALTVEHLLESQRLEGRRVGFIMDLSNHACLYEKDIPKDILYHQIRLVAKVVPPPDFIAQVRQAVEAFLREHHNEYIAIHCAYGFNRTGFVVCACLCELEGMSLNEALELFAKSSQLSASTTSELGYGHSHQFHAPYDNPGVHQEQASPLTTLPPSGSEGKECTALSNLHAPSTSYAGATSAESAANNRSCSINCYPDSFKAPHRSSAEQGQPQQRSSAAAPPDPSQPAFPPGKPSSHLPRPTSPRPASTTVSQQSNLQAQGRYTAPTASCRPRGKANKSAPHIKAASSHGTSTGPPSPLAQRRPCSAQHHHHHSHSGSQQGGAHTAHSPTMLRTQLSSSKGAALGGAPHATPAPLTAEIICSSQWGAHACTHPLYSAFRSCAATETTSIAATETTSVEGSEGTLPQGGGARDESQPQQLQLLHPVQQVQDLGDAWGHSPCGADSGSNHTSTAGLASRGLPTLQEGLPAQPRSPQEGGMQPLAAGDGSGQGQVLAEEVGGDMRQAPSNASSIGNWLDAYLDQQAVLSQAVTMEGVQQDQLDSSGTNKSEEGCPRHSLPRVHQ